MGENFQNRLQLFYKYISAPSVTTEAVVTEEDDINNVNNSVGQEEVDQDEGGSNKTVTYLTQSKNNFMNFFVCICRISDCFFSFLPSSDKKVIEVDPNAVQPEFLYDIQTINTQQQNDVQTEVDSTESEEDTEKERKS